MQLAYVVRDLEATLSFWTEALRVGPFVVIENAADDRIVAYRGAKTRAKMTLAFSYVRDVQIEIIAASCLDPTPWTDFLDSGRQGLHHVAVWPDDFDGACTLLEARGFTPDCRIETCSGDVAGLFQRAGAPWSHGRGRPEQPGPAPLFCAGSAR